MTQSVVAMLRIEPRTVYLDLAHAMVSDQTYNDIPYIIDAALE